MTAARWAPLRGPHQRMSDRTSGGAAGASRAIDFHSAGNKISRRMEQLSPGRVGRMNGDPSRFGGTFIKPDALVFLESSPGLGSATDASCSHLGVSLLQAGGSVLFHAEPIR